MGYLHPACILVAQLADLLGSQVIPFVYDGGIEGLIQQYTEGTVTIQEKSEILHCFTERIWHLMACAVQ